MKTGTFIVAAVLALTSTSSTNSDFLDVHWQLSPHQHPDGKHTTFQIYASFSDPVDQIFAVSCGMGVDLDFWTSDGSDIYNQAFLGGLAFNDFPSVGIGGEAYDSWVTLGNTNLGNVGFTPGFLGGTGADQVILGSEFTEADGAWYFPGDAPFVSSLEDAVEDNDTFDIVIAQFTVNAGTEIHLSSNIAWLNNGFTHISFFEVNTNLCPWDLDESGSVGAFDLLTLLAQWGTEGPADFDGSGTVGVTDLISLLANWGPCP